jgi:hypothetical protein
MSLISIQISLYVKYPSISYNLIEPVFLQQMFENTVIKFHEFPPSGNPFTPCAQTDRRTDGRTDKTKLIVTFHNFANASKRDTPYVRIVSALPPFSVALLLLSLSTPSEGLS